MEAISLDVRNVTEVIVSDVRTSETYCWRELEILDKNGVVLRISLFSADVDDDALRIKA